MSKFISRKNKNKIFEERKSRLKYDNGFEKKIAIYTSIFGSYDDVIEPLYKNQNCDYYLFTDYEISQESTWKLKHFYNPEFSKLSNTEKNRYIKMHPHLFFNNYEYSLYIDGNIQIVADIIPIILNMGNSFLAIHNHNLRSCLFLEAKILSLEKRFKNIKDILKIQTDTYQKEGYKNNQGLYENSIILRKHNHTNCIRVMEYWWKEYQRFTTRDQISFPYVLWKCNISTSEIYIIGENLRKNPRFRQLNHKKLVK